MDKSGTDYVNNRSTMAYLVLVMTLVAVAIASVSIWRLYSVSLDIEKTKFLSIAESQVRMLEAVARFDKKFSADDVPGGARAATLSQLLDAFGNSERFREKGEYVIAERQGTDIVFLVSDNQRNNAVELTIPWDSHLAEPMRRALSGESGIVVAHDYAGVEVMAAYFPVTGMNLGFVAKSPIATVRGPYILMACLSALGSLIILLIGILIFRQIRKPMLRQAEAEGRFRLLLDSTAEAIYGADLEGCCTFVNRACVEMLGYQDRAEIIGKNMHDLAHHTRPDGTDYPNEECKIFLALRTGQGIHVDDEMLWRANGSSFSAEYWSHPIFKDGKLVGSVSNFIDISERVKTQNDLQREKARLSAILDLAMNAVVSIDEQHRIQIFNVGAESIFGYAADEVLGKHIDILIPDRARSAHAKHLVNFQQLFRPQRIGNSRSDIIGRRKDGSEFPAAASVSMIEFGGEKILTATLEDLTVKRQTDAKLQQAQKMEAVGQLTSGIAHDFNNMLSVVMGFIELAEDKAEKGEKGEDIRRYLSGAMHGAQRGADLNRQLLTFSRQQVLENKITNIGEIVRRMTNLLSRTLGEEIELIFQIHDCYSNLDPALLESAILNLAINARDAMPRGGKLCIETALSPPPMGAGITDAEKKMTCISITDNGSGMTDEVLTHALEPFFTTKSIGAGSGLGLSMVHGFVKQTGGKLTISSEVGKGTSIQMLFPMAIAIHKDPDESPGGKMPRAVAREVVLVIEDQDEVRDVIITYLGDLGYQVLEAGDGNKALRILEAFSSVDLILSDITLPGGMRGDEVVAKAQSIQPGLKAIFMSGNLHQAATSGRAIKTAIKMLRKPFRKHELALAVRSCLDQR